MTERRDRQPEDVESPLVPAADPDLDGSGDESTERAKQEADRSDDGEDDPQ
jgi:hypothetical protein